MRGVVEQVNIHMKYDGYIQRQMRQVEQFQKLENKKIPEDLNYDDVPVCGQKQGRSCAVRPIVYRTGVENFGRVASGYIGAVGVARA